MTHECVLKRLLVYEILSVCMRLVVYTKYGLVYSRFFPLKKLHILSSLVDLQRFIASDSPS